MIEVDQSALAGLENLMNLVFARRLADAPPIP
jgi:hypothetical protein